MKNRAELYKQAVEFNPEDDLSFESQDVIINHSVPHTKRDKPAWEYSLQDAKLGMDLLTKRREPLDKAVVKLIEAVDSYMNRAGGIIAKQRLSDALAELDRTFKTMGVEE